MNPSIFLHFYYCYHLLPYHSPYESLCFQSCLPVNHSPQKSQSDLSKTLIKSKKFTSYNLLYWFLATCKIKTSFLAPVVTTFLLYYIFPNSDTLSYDLFLVVLNCSHHCFSADHKPRDGLLIGFLQIFLGSDCFLFSNHSAPGNF